MVLYAMRVFVHLVVFSLAACAGEGPATSADTGTPTDTSMRPDTFGADSGLDGGPALDARAPDVALLDAASIDGVSVDGVSADVSGDSGSGDSGSAIVIGSVEVLSVTTVGARIRWTLNRPGTGYIEYGLTSDYGERTIGEDSFDWDMHIQAVDGLMSATLYHFRVHSTDSDGNDAVSEDLTFMTEEMVAPGDYRLVHASDDGTFASHGRLARQQFHGRTALVMTHDDATPAPINTYNQIGGGPRGGIEGGGARAGLLRVKIYCEDNACWNDGGGKILGLYGGNSAGGATVAGTRTTHGCPTLDTLSLEGGWSHRFTANRSNGHVSMYTYEQNRCRFGAAAYPDGRVFGRSTPIRPITTLPAGRWVQLELEVIMNDEGMANGSGRIEVDGTARGSADGIMWQSRASEFGVHGFLLSFQWQGGETVTVGSSLGLSDFEFYVRD